MFAKLSAVEALVAEEAREGVRWLVGSQGPRQRYAPCIGGGSSGFGYANHDSHGHISGNIGLLIAFHQFGFVFNLGSHE